MFDPRENILLQFTNNKVSATAGTTTKYIEISIREENEEGDVDHTSSVGCIILEPPVVPNIEEVDIGVRTLKCIVLIKGTFWLRKDKDIKQRHTFANSILDSFQTTIKDYASAIVSNGYIQVTGCDPVRTGELLEKSISILAYKYE